jgi:ribosomal protein S18 acetylase RimI-like enzyme
MCRHETCELRIEFVTRETAPGALEEVFGAMSLHTRYMRYHAATPRLTSSMARALTDIDGRHHVAWQARSCNRVVGLVRLVDDRAGIPELAVEVADDFARSGIGRSLVSVALDHATERGAGAVGVLVHPENMPAIRLFRAAGAKFTYRDGALAGEIPLALPRPAAA